MCFLAHSSGEDDNAQHVHALARSGPGAHHHIRRRRQVQLEVADIAAAVFAVTVVVLEVVDECATCHTQALRCLQCLHDGYAVSAILRHAKRTQSDIPRTFLLIIQHDFSLINCLKVTQDQHELEFGKSMRRSNLFSERFFQVNGGQQEC